MDYKALAAKAVEKNDNPFTEGKEKITLEELIASYGHNLKILEVGYVTMKGVEVPCMCTAEAPHNWCSGGAVLGNLIEGCIKESSLEDFNAYLANNPLPVHIEKKKQKKDPSRTYWHYDVTG